MIAARILDVFLILVLVGYLGEGFRGGIIHSLGVIGGSVLGGGVAFFAVPFMARNFPVGEWQPLVSITLSIILLGCGYLFGGALVRRTRRHKTRQKSRRDISTPERLSGAAMNFIAASLMTTLVAGSVASLGVPFVSQAIRGSMVVSTIDRLTPTPFAGEISRVRSAILGITSPTFEGDFGANTLTVPPLEVNTALLDRASASVARISGFAFACAQNQTGSGFVIAPERVATNAHVVAGVDSLLVELPDGQTLIAKVVAFEPDIDLAILLVPGLVAVPLDFGVAETGQRGVIDGYPHGGPFVSSPAEIVRVHAEMITQAGESTEMVREVLTLVGKVQPGNSGGPFVTEDGRVAGMIFARDVHREDVGYATNVSELIPLVQQAESLQDAVPTGSCLRG